MSRQKVGLFGPVFDRAISRHLNLDGTGIVFMAATEVGHIDTEAEDIDGEPSLIYSPLGANLVLFGISTPGGGKLYEVVELTNKLESTMHGDVEL